MKYLLSAMLLFSLTARAQWQKIYTGSSKDLYDIHFSGSNGYIAGQNSALLKSTDSGKTWKNLVLSIPGNLRAVYFISPDTGFVTGENARIQKTYNGGTSWTQKYVRTAAYAYDIRFSGPYGLAVGKDMLAVSSRDYGETWTVDTTPLWSKSLNSVCIGADGVCWAAGDSGTLLRKHVNELGWKTVYSGTLVHLNSIQSISPAVVIACGGMPDTAIVGKFYNVIIKSTDSGKTWQQTTAPELKTINAAVFIRSDTGFFTGSNGIISRTYDGFSQRAQQLSGTASTLNGAALCGQTVFICGDGGTLLYSRNRGGYGLHTEAPEHKTYSLYPQPAQNAVYIQGGPEILRIELFDARGLKTEYRYDEHLRRISTQTPGLYLLRIHGTDGSVQLLRMLIQG